MKDEENEFKKEFICKFNANKNTWGVKKVRGRSEATCKQAGATNSFDIS